MGHSCLYSSCFILQVSNMSSPFFSFLFLCHLLLAKGLLFSSPLYFSDLTLKNRSASFFSLNSSGLIILLANGLCHSSLNSSLLVLLLATGLHHSCCCKTCLFLHLATGLHHLSSYCLQHVCVILISTILVLSYFKLLSTYFFLSTLLISSYSLKWVCIILLSTLVITSYS